MNGETSKDSGFDPFVKDSSFDAAKYYPQNVQGTTWLKPLPWDGIHKDERKEIEQELLICRAIYSDYDPNRPKLYNKMFEDRLMIAGTNPGEYNFGAGSIVQVISVQICHQDNPYWNQFRISGHISITDDKNNVFYVYDNHESISFSTNTLSLEPCRLAPVMRGNVKFNLMKDGDTQIFDTESVVEYKINDDSKSLRFDGKHGFYALMIHNIIPYAYIARVGMNIHDADHYIARPDPFGAYGTIKAKSTNVRGDLKDSEVVCFEKKKSEPVLMYHGRGIKNNIEMFPHLFAVSVFSPLLFDFSLWLHDGTALAVGQIDDTLNPGALVVSNQNYDCDNEYYRLFVGIDWFSPRQLFGSKEFNCGEVHVKRSRGNWQQMEQPIHVPVVDDQNLKMSHFPLVGQIAKPPAAGPRLVEVYSILVERDSSCPHLSLSGTIVLRHRDETLYIFSRNKNLPNKLLLNEQGFRRCVSLAWSDKSWVEEESFFMHLKLKDDEDNEICRGGLRWSPYDDLLYDRRHCEIILGKKGYFASVHYSIFSNGLRAKLTLQCCSVCANENDCISVYGSVFAEYSNHRYQSAYDKQYYRSIIFNRSLEDRIFVENCYELPLSKSRVCAPSNCKELIIDFDLVVEVHPVSLDPSSLKSSSCPLGNVHAVGRIPFKAKVNAVREIHNKRGKGWGCEGCCIRVMVDWF